MCGWRMNEYLAYPFRGRTRRAGHPIVGLAVVPAHDSFGLLLHSPRMREYNMYNFRCDAPLFVSALPSAVTVVLRETPRPA